MKKIFVLTGEASGDKLASKVIGELNKLNPNIEYLSVGGENLGKLGIRSIYDLKEITYLGFTNVLFNIFKIKKKINDTVKAIEKFKPDILLTVDSPDFTLRVAERIKIKKPEHILLLFNFEKSYFEKENMSHEFVGHPLLDSTTESAIDINQILGKNKALISIFAGSRKSEIDILTPILLNFIKLMNEKYNDFYFVFHATKEYSDLIQFHIRKNNLNNCEVINDSKIKDHILKKSVFAVSKSGTISLEISKAKITSVILYKMGLINFFIIKMLVKTNFANIINVAAKKEIIPELLQSNCNPQKIFEVVSNYLDNPNKIDEQISKTQKILKSFKTNTLSSTLAAKAINKYL